MPSTFKYLTDDSIKSIVNKLYESVPITGTYISGTYVDTNIKNYSHDRYVSVYDYPYLSSSANAIIDITFGYANSSALSNSANTQNNEKILNYTEMAQVLQGFDLTGTIQLFDQDGNLNEGGTKLKECVFLLFNRSLTKDGIKKGSFSATFFTGNSWVTPLGREEINDAHATTNYFVNSPTGEWSYLSGSTKGKVGLIFYGAGVVVLTGSLFTASGGGQTPVFYSSSASPNKTFDQAMTSTSISASVNGLRRHINNIQFVNTTELYSQIVFCNIGSNEFNYSSNPTYLTASRIRVKDDPTDQPITYITEVGLYSADNELLAVGKLSSPLKKSNSNLNLQLRLDF